jgi:CRISPR-associated protein Csc3
MADELLLILNNQQKPLVDHYLETVARGGLRKYRATTQTGIRSGHDLYSHLVRGGLLAHSLGTLFGFPDEEIRLLMAAFSIHDLNKLYEPGGKSLRKLADDRAFFEQVIHDSGVAEFFPDWRESFTDLKQLVLGHGAHTTAAGERLLARIDGSRLTKDRLNELTHLMRAVDISDIDESFTERKFKDKFLLEINSVGARQYRLVSHRLGEHRGVLSNLIHNGATDVLKSDYEATPVFLSPEGTWYLVPVDTTLPDRATFLEKVSGKVRQSLQAIRNQDLSKIVVLTKDGVKTDASLFGLGLSAEGIITAITQQVFRRKFASREIEANRDKCDERLQRKAPKGLTAYCGEHGVRYPETPEEMQAGELLRALYNLVNTHFLQEAASLTDGVTEPWTAIYRLFDLKGDAFEPFDKLYDRPFVVAGTLDKSYESLEEHVTNILSRLLDSRGMTGVVETGDFLSAYLAEVLDIDFAPRPAADFAAYFRAYTGQNHRQCCYSAFSGQAESWMSAEVPKGIVVQQFSNRLEGGVKREPKRNICPVCREQFFLEQMLFRSGGAKGMYLHFFPEQNLPAAYLDTLRQTLQDLAQKADPDTFFLPTETSLVDGEEDFELHLLAQKARGFSIPRRNEAIGNTITLSVCPGVDVTSDGERLLSCAEVGLRLGKLLGLRCLVSEAPIPPLGPQQFGDFYLDTLPSALQGFFGARDLRQGETDRLLARYAALRIVDREVRTGYDSVAWDLARALGATPLEIFAVADRALERKLRQVASGRDGPLGIRIRARICGDLEKLIAGGMNMADEQALSERIKKMAKVATEYKLWGRSRSNRSSLLDPLSTAFENLRRISPEMDFAFVKAQTIEDIFAHIDRVRRQANPRFKIGKTKRLGITMYVDELYRVLKDVYNDKLSRVLAHEKAIKAAYLCFLSEAMNASNLEAVEEEVEEAEAESTTQQ